MISSVRMETEYLIRSDCIILFRCGRTSECKAFLDITTNSDENQLIVAINLNKSYSILILETIEIDWQKTEKFYMTVLFRSEIKCFCVFVCVRFDAQDVRASIVALLHSLR